jgi:membrane-bound inhibitor of C-type lysozyme
MGEKMNQSNLRGVSLVFFILLLTMGFGCSSDKVFKSGITYTCDGGKSFVLDVYEQVDIAFLKIGDKRYYLPLVASESGKKYSDGSTTLSLKEQSVSVEIEGQPKFKNCLVKPE